jgi:nicotinamide-nucleotide amidase
MDELYKTVDKIGSILTARNLVLALAESCTGGQVAHTITSVPNCSRYFDRCFVTYSNAAKVEMLGVRQETLDKYGAVSEETVREMALGVIKNSHAQISIAITGIAGPTGGTPEKPIGTVYFAWILPKNIEQVICQHFSGDRNSIRFQATQFALKELEKLLLAKK